MSKDGSGAKASGGKNGDAGMVRELAEILSDTGLTEIEMERGDLRVRVVKSPPQQIVHAGGFETAMPATTAQQAPPPETPVGPSAVSAADHPGAVTSPMVGTAYLAAEPGSPAFIAVGQSVTEGDTLLLIEAMKTFNPIKAARSGVIKEILVTDGQPVEFGEPLLVVD